MRKTKLGFGYRVLMHRTQILELSIRDAAADLGISPATLSRIENGKNPDIFTFAKLCRWMGFSESQGLIDLGA